MLDTLNANLPPVRVQESTKEALERIAQASPISKRLSDHVRAAVEEYIAKYGFATTTHNGVIVARQ